jgi:hypothetical protein
MYAVARCMAGKKKKKKSVAQRAARARCACGLALHSPDTARHSAARELPWACTHSLAGAGVFGC